MDSTQPSVDEELVHMQCLNVSRRPLAVH